MARFEDIIGQEQIKEHLQSALLTGKISHAYILNGEKFSGKEFIAHGITPCTVIDTMGAGDSYIAGFLFGILSKESIPTCMQRGADSSAVTIGYFGAW